VSVCVCVCVCVCGWVCLSAKITQNPGIYASTNFLCMMAVAMALSCVLVSSSNVTVSRVFPDLWMSSCSIYAG